MSVFNLSGNEISAVYAKDGTDLDYAYAKDGSEIFSPIEPTSLSEVSEIYQQACVDALTYVESLGESYVNYIVLADTHWESNWHHSAMVCNYLFSNGRFDKFIHLGDTVSDDNVGEDGWNSMTADGYLRYPNRCIWVQGNHDAHLSPLANAEAYLVPASAHHTSHVYNNAYYYDNKNYKIRFIVLHHYLYGSSVIRDEVENWIKYRPSGYMWALLHHAPFNNGTWAETSCVGGETETWWFRLFDTYKGFIGSFCGHLHLDKTDLLQTTNETFFNQVVFDTDTKGGRTDDYNGQSITIMSINPTTENIKFYRIGRNSVYSSNKWEINGFTE